MRFCSLVLAISLLVGPGFGQSNFLNFAAEDPAYYGIGRVVAVSGDGLQAASLRFVGTSSTRPTRWTIDEGFGLGPADLIGYTTDISSSGTYLVGSGKSVQSTGGFQAFRWTAPFGWINLGSLIPGGASGATAVSGGGNFIVGWSASFNGTTAFRYSAVQPIGMVDIGPPGSGVLSRSQDCSLNANVIAGSIASAGFFNDSIRAARWTAATGMQVIGPANVPSDALAISANGQTIVGWMHDSSGSTQPARWTASTGLQILGPLPTGFQGGRATAVSQDGSIIVGTMFGSQVASMPFRWTVAGGIVERLDEVLLQAGLPDIVDDPADYAALDISDDGNAILGSRIGPKAIQTEWLAFLAAPPATKVSTDICSPGIPNSSGSAGKCRAVGSAFLNHNNLVLEATDLPQQKTGLFLASLTEDFLPMAGGSQGNLCLGGAVGRFLTSVGSTGGAGSLVFQLDLTAIAQPTGPQAAAFGETWLFQAWFRDMNPGSTSNFTSAAAVLFR